MIAGATPPLAIRALRWARNTCFVLAGLAAAAAVAFYAYATSMACAFAPPGAACRPPSPWELRGEDLMFLVFWPWSACLLFLALGWLAGRRWRRRHEAWVQMMLAR